MPLVGLGLVLALLSVAAARVATPPDGRAGGERFRALHVEREVADAMVSEGMVA